MILIIIISSRHIFFLISFNFISFSISLSPLFACLSQSFILGTVKSDNNDINNNTTTTTKNQDPNTLTNWNLSDDNWLRSERI